MGTKARPFQMKGGEYVLLPGDSLPAVLVGKVFPAFPLRLPQPPCGGRKLILSVQGLISRLKLCD